MGIKNEEVKYLESLRFGSLLLIFATFFAFLFLISTALGVSSLGINNLGVAVSILSATVVIVLAIGTPGTIRLINGFNGLNRLRKGPSVIGTFGSILFLVGNVLELLGVISLLSSFFTAANIIEISDVISYLGMILIGVGMLILGSNYKEGSITAGGILMIIPIFSLLPLIGFILSYIGLGNVINKVKSGYYTITTSQPLIQQEGIATIKSDGTVITILISQVQGIIRTAILNNQSAISINPSVLNVGRNEIMIDFNGVVQNLVAGNKYVISLSVDIGGNIITIYLDAVYQP